ncbi:MAG: AAA family ATPase [Lachnospiraceae bacterium]|nr:AAA family ATPase [Lachnospiraceae bacterium]
MTISDDVNQVLQEAVNLAAENHYEYITPELILCALCTNESFVRAFDWCGGDIHTLEQELQEYMQENLVFPGEESFETVELEYSRSMQDVLNIAMQTAASSGKNCIYLDNLVYGFQHLEESYAVYFMESQGVEVSYLVAALVDILGTDAGVDQEESWQLEDAEGEEKQKEFEKFAPCMNDLAEQMNPLIGREEELERTIQILCRKDKNNPLHLGEPGVGKTAITYGLAQRINRGQVPEPLKNARIYALDLGSLLAGTQYRGELEKRLKSLLEDISREENPIIYIDEIHNMAGAGAVGESSFDTSNMLKPYLASGSIRFIGATTYEEYKKYFEKNKSLARRFQNVEILEPSEEETVKILQGLKKKYESYHGVKYGKGVLEYAVKMSKKYINERYLPDKAIDLMDEAGAYRRIHPLDQKSQTVGKDVINQILTDICHVPVEAAKQEKGEVKALATLEKRLKSRVFGQDEAVEQVVHAIKFARAGLLEDGKPLSSFLFVGPTGVGK